MGKQHEKIKEINKPIANRITTVLSKEFLLFSTILLLIEMVMPIWTTITICLIVSLVVHAFEDVRIQLSFFSSHMIQLLVFYAILHFLSVVFSDVSSIALGIPVDMRSTAECCMAPFSTVLAL